MSTVTAIALIYLIACGAVLNGLFLWFAYCEFIGWAVEWVRKGRVRL